MFDFNQSVAGCSVEMIGGSIRFFARRSFCSAEIIHYQNVAFTLLVQHQQQPFAVRRDGKTGRAKFGAFLGGHQPRGAPGRKVMELDGNLGAHIRVEKPNALRGNGPKPLHHRLQNFYLFTARHRHAPETRAARPFRVVNELTIG